MQLADQLAAIDRIDVAMSVAGIGGVCCAPAMNAAFDVAIHHCSCIALGPWECPIPLVC